MRRRRRWHHHTRGLSNQGQLGSRSLVIMHHPAFSQQVHRELTTLHFVDTVGQQKQDQDGKTEVDASNLEPRGDPPLGRSLVGQWRRE